MPPRGIKNRLVIPADLSPISKITILPPHHKNQVSMVPKHLKTHNIHHLTFTDLLTEINLINNNKHLAVTYESYKIDLLNII